MVDAVNSFTLLAIPLFIMAGEIMSRSGLMENILGFSDLLVGRLRGGLAHTNIVCSTIFGGISGSAVADVSAIGPVFIPAMQKEGYGLPSVPPSRPRPPFKTRSSRQHPHGDVRRGDGCLDWWTVCGRLHPGLLISVGNMVVVWVLARRRQYPTRQAKIPFRVALRTTLRALPALIMPVVILGGIFRWGVHAHRGGGRRGPVWGAPPRCSSPRR